MKKIICSFMALAFISGAVSLSFAQTPPPAASPQVAAPQKMEVTAPPKMETAAPNKPEVVIETIRGKILSMDLAKSEIVIKENKTGTEKTFSVDPKVLSSFKVNDNVKIQVKPGTNVVEKIKKIVKPTPMKKKSGK